VNFHERTVALSTGTLSVLVCEGCGAVVLHNAADLNKHDKFHGDIVYTLKAVPPGERPPGAVT
jgi:hypothetical protein